MVTDFQPVHCILASHRHDGLNMWDIICHIITVDAVSHSFQHQEMSTLNYIYLKYHDLEQKEYYVMLNHETCQLS